MNYYCNPINIDYRYQFNVDQRQNKMAICREAADPSMIFYKGKYFMFVSMNLSVWVSEDLAHWESQRLPENLPLYDYAPDVRVIGDYVYFSASKRGEICNYYRTKDVINGPYEEISGTFDFWDPNLFEDEDGRIYFYWGCTNVQPMWGVEVDKETMKPIGEKVALIHGKPDSIGYERFGEDHSKPPLSDEEIEVAFKAYLAHQGTTEDQLPSQYLPLIKGMLSNKPFIEGAWMDKVDGKYYLQYAAPGTQFNTYADGVYVGESPLGPFVLADNNPYSYKPGGFIPGAGHGSTMWDTLGNIWHTATMRISVNHDFERRVGLWPAGIDQDGELFCNQRFGDWPKKIDGGVEDPWKDPEWYLLSYNKTVTASSSIDNKGPGKVTDENVQTWWQAASNFGEWIQVDLGEAMDVNAIQINFADDELDIESPGKIRGTTQARYIEEANHLTRWKLEGSMDGVVFELIEDKSEAETDLPHDLVIREKAIKYRFIRLTIIEVPYNVNPCISGLRIFGKGNGPMPVKPTYSVTRDGEMEMTVTIEGEDLSEVVGYNILWGSSPDKLYHCYQTYERIKQVRALVTGKKYFVRVDAFNENGITKGNTVALEGVS